MHTYFEDIAPRSFWLASVIEIPTCTLLNIPGRGYVCRGCSAVTTIYDSSLSYIIEFTVCGNFHERIACDHYYAKLWWSCETRPVESRKKRKRILSILAHRIELIERLCKRKMLQWFHVILLWNRLYTKKKILISFKHISP